MMTDVMAFGALGDGVADDGPAIVEAVEAVKKTNGGLVWFPPGRVYLCSSQIDLTGRFDVTFSGGGRVIYTGTASPFINLRGAQRIVFRDLRMLYANQAFRGVMVEVPPGSPDAGYLWFDNVVFGGQGLACGADAHVKLANTIIVDFARCQFYKADRGLRFVNTNILRMANCTFVDLGTVGVSGWAGQTVLFQSCTFEPRSNGMAGAFLQEAPNYLYGLTFDTCWFGDTRTNGGTWIKNLVTLGCQMRGNFFGTAGAGPTDVGIHYAGGSQGVVIQGNRFEGPRNLRFDGVNSLGVAVMGNDFQGTKPLTVTNTTQLFARGNVGLVNHGT